MRHVPGAAPLSAPSPLSYRYSFFWGGYYKASSRFLQALTEAYELANNFTELASNIAAERAAAPEVKVWLLRCLWTFRREKNILVAFFN